MSFSNRLPEHWADVVAANRADLARIRHEAGWLADNLNDLHAISWSQRHTDGEQPHSHAAVSSGPDLSARAHPQLRDKLADTTRRLKHLAVQITALRVALVPFLEEQGYDATLIGTLLDPGELDQARKAKARRDANVGDPRFGEWEATPDRQPGTRFKGGAA